MEAGNYGNTPTTCTAGSICPPGAQDDSYLIPPGWFAAGTGITAFSDNELTVCPAGSWCAAGSTDSTT